VKTLEEAVKAYSTANVDELLSENIRQLWTELSDIPEFRSLVENDSDSVIQQIREIYNRGPWDEQDRLVQEVLRDHFSAMFTGGVIAGRDSEKGDIPKEFEP
jgi:hypothetical protein